jgi:hypothetical protein
MYFAMQPGKHAECMAMLYKICTKMVTDMHYDARVSCVRNWYTEKRNVRISKSQARNKHLDAWRYMQVSLGIRFLPKFQFGFSVILLIQVIRNGNRNKISFLLNWYFG